MILILATAGCVLTGKRPTQSEPSTASNPAETVDQAALIAANAKLEAEINALKNEAGRDSFAGLTYQSVYPVGVAVSQTMIQLALMLLMWTIMRMSHQRELARINKGIV